MNSVEAIAEKAKTGIWGLDNILSGGFSRGHVFLVEGAPGTGKTTDRAAIPDGRRQGRREVPLHHSVGNRTRVARRRGLPWLDAGRSDRGVRIAAAGKPARFRPAAEPALFVGSRTRRNHQADLRGGGTGAAEPGGARQPFRDQAAGAKLAALPAADSGDQALFREIRHHGDAARRSDRRSSPTRPCTASRMACCGWRNWRRLTARSGGARASSNIAASSFAAAITTSPSPPAG